MILNAWLNLAWMCKSSRELWAFHRATRRVAQTQADVLGDILHANRATEFGLAHGFDQITSLRDFQDRVPLATYEDFAPAIQRIGEGQSSVLTDEPVELLEPTSGTSGGEKLIPYTAALRSQFQRGVAAWIADLFWHRPVLWGGRSYWSISPAFGGPRRTEGGIPIGFDDDASYLGGLERFALERLLAVPGVVAQIPEIDAFRYCTLLHLLRAADLRLISVWNPTFLTALLEPLGSWHQRLCSDLERGTLSIPLALPTELFRRLAPPGDWAGRRRAARLAHIFRTTRSLPDQLRQIWPALALISCWSDAAAARFVTPLRELFPQVEIQPKGLLATEGFVSFPLIGCPAPALAIRSHFFEFQESGLADSGRPCALAHELERGGRYRVVLTTGGGLYRYQLRDEVEVVGFLKQCPLLRFLGKVDRVSDLVGEKLAELHIRAVLDRLFAHFRMTPAFAMLVPVLGRPPRYRLYLQGSFEDYPPAFAPTLQLALEENPHYRHAVRLGQLGAVDVHVLDRWSEPGWQIYERRCLARGQKAGDIKPTVLDSWTGWPDEFRRVYATAPVGASQR